uniref:Transmembrane protein n=1 Tax=Globisporangium ultimum (strain ATCC 200006 / CBS 805.95 / DAOM BR144) TaxID=431595 RepID=K3X5S0_GLOUD
MRKEQKLVLGFVATLAGVVGTLHVYLPFYSSMGIQAHERAGMKSKDDQEKAKRSASMWKNMDKKTRE